jgi:hypothetical protein
MRFGSPKPWSRWWHAPVLLLVYQIAPVQAHLDETGRIQVGLGFSGGHYEDRAFSCGDLVRRSPVTYRVIGGQAEVWASRSVRFSAGGGVLRSSSDSGRVELPKGAFGSMLVAYEGKNFGIGGGVTAWPGTLIEYGESSTPREFEEPTQVLPSGYLRFGRADKVHLRFDDNASSAPGTLPGYRFGVASGYSERWQPRWFAGLMGQEKTSGIGGELGFPVGQRLEPVIHGSASFSKDSPGWSLGLAVRTGLGKTRRP